MILHGFSSNALKQRFGQPRDCVGLLPCNSGPDTNSSIRSLHQGRPQKAAEAANCTGKHCSGPWWPVCPGHGNGHQCCSELQLKTITLIHPKSPDRHERMGAFSPAAAGRIIQTLWKQPRAWCDSLPGTQEGRVRSGVNKTCLQLQENETCPQIMYMRYIDRLTYRSTFYRSKPRTFKTRPRQQKNKSS